jgi:metal-responsive CopG/Arc/MetJ family transcriptional regulator
MPTKKNIISFLADDELLKQVDDYRRAKDSIPSRSEAVRLLVVEGLKTSKTSKAILRK